MPIMRRYSLASSCRSMYMMPGLAEGLRALNAAALLFRRRASTETPERERLPRSLLHCRVHLTAYSCGRLTTRPSEKRVGAA